MARIFSSVAFKNIVMSRLFRRILLDVIIIVIIFIIIIFMLSFMVDVFSMIPFWLSILGISIGIDVLINIYLHYTKRADYFKK